MVNINIKVDDDVHKRMKLLCVKNGSTIQDFVNWAIVEKIDMDDLED